MAAPDAAGLMAPPNAVQTRIRRLTLAASARGAPAAAEAPAEAPVEAAAEAPPPQRGRRFSLSRRRPDAPAASTSRSPAPASSPPPKRRGYSVKAWENRDDLELEA